MKKYHERLAALASHWNSVEGRIKQYEHFSGEANTAAINELRYCGRKIVDGLAVIVADGDPEAEFTIAENYMINADHDVTDGVCFIVMQHLKKVLDKYGKEKIAQHYADFWEVYPLVLRSQKIVETSREDRINRKADYAKLAQEYLPKLKALHEAITQIKALHVPNEEDEIRRLQTWATIITGITILGFIFGFLAVVIGLLSWAYPEKYWQIFWSIF